MEKTENCFVENNGGAKKLSVIISCYNAEKYLDACFKSLSRSTYKNVQIIFVDDGSNDGTYDKIKGFAKKTDNCFFVKIPHSGPATGRNKGLELATGDYITFYDVDDILSPVHFEVLVDALESSGADVVAAAFTRKSEKKLVKNPVIKLKEFFGDDCLERLLCQNSFDYCVWNKLYKADIIKNHNVRFLDGTNYGEDSYFNYFYFKHVKKAVFSCAKTYYYVKSPNSLVTSAFKESRLDVFINLTKVLEDSAYVGGTIDASAHACRGFFVSEALWFILKSDYRNYAVINKLNEWLKEDLKYLHKAKRVSLFRRTFMPLVPFISFVTLGKGEKRRAKYSLPDNFDY